MWEDSPGPLRSSEQPSFCAPAAVEITGQLFPSPHHPAVKESARPLNERWLSRRLAHLKSTRTLQHFNNSALQAVHTARAFSGTVFNMWCHIKASLGQWNPHLSGFGMPACLCIQRTPMACIFNVLITGTHRHGAGLSWGFTVLRFNVIHKAIPINEKLVVGVTLLKHLPVVLIYFHWLQYVWRWVIKSIIQTNREGTDFSCRSAIFLNA